MSRLKSFTHRIAGRLYRIQWRTYLGKCAPGSKHDAAGKCDPPDSPRPTIRIISGMPEGEELRVLIHEGLHAADWSKDEEWVDQVSSDLAGLLTRAGYGRTS